MKDTVRVLNEDGDNITVETLDILGEPPSEFAKAKIIEFLIGQLGYTPDSVKEVAKF
jgi:hypothetical protein